MEIKIKNINFGEKTIKIKSGTVKDLIKALGTNDDSVIFVDQSGKICTIDENLEGHDCLTMVEVFSGG
ncbi:hypothetical protein M1293_03045 [Candidatus Parvarchaeota archaeon]|nr:hypothetical protein [Candidatus Parvarchaeota archaeon]